MVSFKTLFRLKNAFFEQNFSEVKKRCDKDNSKTPLSSSMIDGGGLWRCSAGNDRYLRDERHFLFPPIFNSKFSSFFHHALSETKKDLSL